MASFVLATREANISNDTYEASARYKCSITVFPHLIKKS